MHLFAWLLLFSCDNPEQSDHDAQSNKPVHHWAWPIENGTLVQHKSGSLVTPTGVKSFTDAVPCSTDWYKVPIVDGLLTFTDAPEVTFAPAPAVQAATVERVSWRLRQALPPSTRIKLGGVSDIAPAVSDGLLVRSVRKHRRSGPPILAAVGIWENTLIAALIDREGATTLATVTETVPLLSKPTPLPIIDLNHDNQLEWLIYSNGPTPYRLVIEATLNPHPSLGASILAAQPSQLCGDN